MTDRRTRRHEATRQEILAAAWALAHERGLTGWSLRELAGTVDMRAPSLYVYFDKKHAIYDEMFAQGCEQLLAWHEATPPDGLPAELLGRIAHTFIDFCMDDPARYQLLFLRIIPDFAPSKRAYALAEEALDRLRVALASAGITSPRSVDLWTAVTMGLVTQQMSNDPDGQRWARLVDDAVGMFLATVET